MMNQNAAQRERKGRDGEKESKRPDGRSGGLTRLGLLVRQSIFGRIARRLRHSSSPFSASHSSQLQFRQTLNSPEVSYYTFLGHTYDRRRILHLPLVSCTPLQGQSLQNRPRQAELKYTIANNWHQISMHNLSRFLSSKLLSVFPVSLLFPTSNQIPPSICVTDSIALSHQTVRNRSTPSRPTRPRHIYAKAML